MATTRHEVTRRHVRVAGYHLPLAFVQRTPVWPIVLAGVLAVGLVLLAGWVAP